MADRPRSEEAPADTAFLIRRESPLQADVAQLVTELDAHLGALYPAESNHLLDLSTLAGPDTCFLAARDSTGALAGCGAWIRRGNYAEIKRMMVPPRLRGIGLGRRLLAALEAAAQQDGLRLLRLETGIHQPEALRLYEAAGYTYIAPFGDYREDPLSVFMEKHLP